MYLCTITQPNRQTATAYETAAALLAAVLPTLPPPGQGRCSVLVTKLAGDEAEVSDETDDCDDPALPLYCGAMHEDGCSFATWEGALLYALASIAGAWTPGY
jgi:hypothetical protein